MTSFDYMSAILLHATAKSSDMIFSTKQAYCVAIYILCCRSLIRLSWVVLPNHGRLTEVKPRSVVIMEICVRRQIMKTTGKLPLFPPVLYSRLVYRRHHITCKSCKKIESSLYSWYYAEACNECRDPSPQHSE